jgi:hypothetical protein
MIVAPLGPSAVSSSIEIVICNSYPPGGQRIARSGIRCSLAERLG